MSRQTITSVVVIALIAAVTGGALWYWASEPLSAPESAMRDEHEEEEFERVMKVNLRGPFLASQAAARQRETLR